MPPFVPFLILIALFSIQVLIMVSVIKRCYLVVPADTAIVKTGWGPVDVMTAGGMLIYPVINQVLFVSLKWHQVDIEFDDSRPLAFAGGERVSAKLTAWISVDNTSKAIIEAAQSFGEQCSDPEIGEELVEKLYRDPIEQVVRRIAKDSDFGTLTSQLPELPNDLMIAISESLESFHMLHRATIVFPDHDTALQNRKR